MDIKEWHKRMLEEKKDIAQSSIKRWIRESIKVKESLWNAPWMQGQIYEVADCIAQALEKGNKVLVCGNGGSSSDAAHFCGELNNQFSKKRVNSLPALDLSAMNATLTAIANDSGYDFVFSKQVAGFAKPGDVVIGISTSGSSPNVLHALWRAKEVPAKTVLLTGKYKKEYVVSAVLMPSMDKIDKVTVEPDYVINVDSTLTPLIQETHITILHIIANLIDSIMFGVDYLEDL